MKFSVIYKPTSLFSLKSSNATNSGAKSLLLPSPYAIKMAILNQAITVGGDLERLSNKNSKEFGYIRDAKIEYFLSEGGSFCVNNSFVKILKPVREGCGFQQTVAFREYVYISDEIEIIFEVEGDEAKSYLKQYLFRINYFGKKGCFFQFVNYSDSPNLANVRTFSVDNFVPGILEEYDDFGESVIFDNVDNFSSAKAKRGKKIFSIPVSKVSSSKSFSCYKVN